VPLLIRCVLGIFQSIDIIYSMLQNISIGMLLGKAARLALDAYDNILYKTRELIRPGRQNERKKRPKKLHYMNYKRL
jgi:hypothetical protein